MNTMSVIRVLLIDDDEVDQSLTRLSLSKSTDARFEVEIADRLLIAEERLAVSRFDIILLDLGLPESCGLSTLDRVRRMDDQTPIVVLTDLQDKEAALESLDRGAQDYLSKNHLAVGPLCRSIQHSIQRHQLHQQLSEANAQLQNNNERLELLCETAQRFVDNVSHEFRTPLTVIKEYVSLLREGFVGEVKLDADQLRFLDVVADRADDLNTMVDDMLDASKLETGLLGVWRQSCKVAEIFERVLPALERKAALKDVSIWISPAEGIPNVYCDPEKIGRVIINLAVNAIKFAKEPGRVRVSAQLDDSGRDVVISVSDNGPGIDEVEIAGIFDRFKQLDTQPRGTNKGFGLGLNIARELVHLNFGDLCVESHPGDGATFSFTVPISDPLEVVSRFALQTENAARTQFELLSAQISADEEVDLADDVDATLHYLQRDGSLIVRTSRTNWILMLVDDDDEFMPRVQECIDATNRNRPYDPLPPVKLTLEGVWQAAESTDRLRDLVASILGRGALCHATS